MTLTVGDRTMFMTRASIGANLALAAAKFAVAIASLSLFPCLGALYNIGIALAKYNALVSIGKTQHMNGQRQACRIIGGMLLAASLVYIGYSTSLFFHPHTPQYSLYTGLIIALFTFVEIPLHIRNVMSARKRNDPVVCALRWTSLAAALICLVLTQTALLAAMHPGADLSAANGLSGILFGSLAAMIGLYVLLKIPSSGTMPDSAPVSKPRHAAS